VLIPILDVLESKSRRRRFGPQLACSRRRETASRILNNSSEKGCRRCAMGTSKPFDFFIRRTCFGKAVAAVLTWERPTMIAPAQQICEGFCNDS
jgi:hypothetical protein